MTRNRWWVAGLVIVLVLAGLVVAGRAKRQLAAQQSQPLLTASAPMPMSPEPSSTQAAAITPSAAAPMMAAAQQAAKAPAQAVAAMPATAGEIGGPIEIQTTLANAGFYTGPIDGKIGPATRQAIEAFQRANGLTADGKVGAKTWTALKAHLASSPPPAQATATQPPQ